MSVTFKEYIKYPVESTHNNKFCQLEKFEKNWNFDFFFGGEIECDSKDCFNQSKNIYNLPGCKVLR